MFDTQAMTNLIEWATGNAPKGPMFAIERTKQFEFVELLVAIVES